MLLLVGAVAFLVAVLLVIHMRRRRQGRHLGWMSEQWVAEHRWSRRV